MQVTWKWQPTNIPWIKKKKTHSQVYYVINRWQPTTDLDEPRAEFNGMRIERSV